MKQSGRALLAVVLTVAFLHSFAHGQDKKQSTTKTTPAHLKKAMANPADDPNLPNVLVIGDSISIGYTVAVRKLLDGKADVFRPRTNCAYSGKGVANIKRWLGNTKWDVIHFNFGIWDTHWLHEGKLVRTASLSKHKKEDLKRRYSTEEHVENLSKIVGVMKKTGAKLVWASTTPFVSYGEDTKQLLEKNNKAAKALMEKEGVVVNDLYGLALPNLKKWQTKDGCHFTGQGSAELARQVASSIVDLLKR